MQSELYDSSWVRKYPKLHEKQTEAVEFILEEKKIALFFGMGTGKTFISARTIEALADESFSGLQVVLLANIESTWVPVLQRITGLNLCRTWEEFKAAPCPRLLLLHYEAMPPLDYQLTSTEWTYASFDESQRLKDRGSLASRIAGRIKWCKYRVILTGTPFDDIKKDPQQLWAQFRFLRPKLFGDPHARDKGWSIFDAEYLYRTGYMGKQRKFRQDKLDEFIEKLSPFSKWLNLRDVRDMPSPRIIRKPFNLLGKSSRIYRELEKDLVSQISKDKRLKTDLTITRDAKMHQLCSGFVMSGNKREKTFEVHKTGTTKIKRLRLLLWKVPTPVVIFCRYDPAIEMLVKEAHRETDRVAVICGKNRATREQVKADFQAGKIDVLVCQLKSGGTGIDLFAAHVCIFFSMNWSYIDFHQAISRLDRPGQMLRVKVYLLYARNTIDEDTYAAAIKKEDVSKYVGRKIQERWAAYKTGHSR